MQDQIQFTPAQLRRMARHENTVLALGIIGIAFIAYADVVFTAIGPAIRAWTGG